LLENASSRDHFLLRRGSVLEELRAASVQGLEERKVSIGVASSNLLHLTMRTVTHRHAMGSWRARGLVLGKEGTSVGQVRWGGGSYNAPTPRTQRKGDILTFIILQNLMAPGRLITVIYAHHVRWVIREPPVHLGIPSGQHAVHKQ
jgi:hypothetical protein